jgi:hypothetical protein
MSYSVYIGNILMYTLANESCNITFLRALSYVSLKMVLRGPKLVEV